MTRSAAVRAGLVAAVVAVYWNALDNPFVYDDVATVVENPSLADLSNWVWVLTWERFRPVVNASYAFDRLLWGFDPFGFHLTSVVLHAVNCVLAWMLVRMLDREAGQGTSRTAAVAAALFAVHPMMTEGVGYVSGRSEVLAGTFVLSSLVCFGKSFRTGGRRWVPAALTLWLLGMASREVAAVVPLVLVAWDALLLEPEGRRVSGRRRWLHAPLLLLVVAGAALRAAAYFEQETGIATGVVGRNALTQTVVAWRYVGLLVLPLGQSLVHATREVQSVANPAFLASATGVALAVALAWRFRARQPLAVFGACWFAVFLLPTMAVPLNELMAEHRVYLASLGLFVTAASLVTTAWDRPVVRIAVGTVIAVLALATILRNRVWDDEEALWADAVENAPGVYAPRYELGNVYRTRGECERAIPRYEEALTILPGEVEGWSNLGICLATVGRTDAARRAFVRATEVAPRSAKGHNNLGLLALTEHDVAGARKHFEAALAVEPGNDLARRKLAALPPSP